ncbi:hypothetical protein IGI37_002498 [Enterococcus sp. AZ194]|uniref:PadR family transcriptional regulator n=1 Tax=Enterococcus sp. AZ194 TaxID=2774629 RepID=UPI003F27F129
MDETLTDSTYLILLALLRPQHGYAIMKEVSELTKGTVEIGPASMYTILKKLQKNQYITLENTNDRKKVYTITESGKEVLKKDIQRRKLFFEAGQKLLVEGGEV